MGRPTKKRKSRSSKKADTQNPNPPKFSSPTLVVGRVQSNIIQSILAPALTDLAVKSVESYADQVLEDALLGDALMGEEGLRDSVLDGGEKKEEVEVELDLDGNIVASSSSRSQQTSTNNKSTEKKPLLLFATQSDIDEFQTVLDETSSHFSTPSNAWKIHANAAKFERLLDEKYGRFRPIIESHPQIEVFFKNIQRKYAMGAFSPLKEKNPVNKTTAIMILFMMHRQNVRADALILMAIFCLVGLQPWALVTLVAVGRWEMERRKGRKIGGMPTKMKECEPYYAKDVASDMKEEEERAKKYEILSTPVGTKYNPADLSLRDETYDVILLGSGVETLYAAALLARAGRKVCVLSGMEDVSECRTFDQQQPKKGNDSKGREAFASVPFDIKSANVSHLARQQKLLAPALCTTTDTQGGIRFARIGSASDGYAHSILSVPGLGTDTISYENTIPVVVNAMGPMALAEYCATSLGDGFPPIGSGVDAQGNADAGNSTSLGYLHACAQINKSSGDHYLSKLMKASNDSSNVYQQATIRPASTFLNKCLPLNPHLRSLMAALGSANENLSPQSTCMAAHISHLCAMTSPEGMAYPIGGPRALCHALTGVIEQCDGKVVAGVSLQELLFDKLPEDDKKKKKPKQKEGEADAATAEHTGPKPRCRGIRLQNGCEIKVTDGSDNGDIGEGAVISMLGLLPTFLHLLPPDLRLAHGVSPGLPAVSERRPLMKMLVGLRGTADELDITGADWYRCPNATLPIDEMDLTGQVKFGNIGVGDDDGDGSGEGGDRVITDDAAPASSAGRRGKQSKSSTASSTETKKHPRSKFTSGQSWMKVSFPSAKDPSWSDRYGPISTCVITIEADDDFVRMFDTKPKMYSILNKSDKTHDDGSAQRLMDRVMKDLVENFPQLGNKVECIQLCGPFRSGLSQNAPRFAIKGNRPVTTYPGLYLGGSDLTVSDSFSGAIVGAWLAANAVMGYSAIDHLYLKKNITSDLERFLDEPSVAYVSESGGDVEDLAVPFETKEESDDGMIGKKKEGGDVEPTNTAESSKEE